MIDHAVTVMLNDWEIDWAKHVGGQRRIINLEKADASHYDPTLKQPEEIASPASAVCEMAVAKHLNLYWDGSYWQLNQHNQFREMPDLAPNIEVRRTRTNGGECQVRLRDVLRNRRMISAHVDEQDFSTGVIIQGWIDAAQGWEEGVTANYDKKGNTRLVHSSLLFPITTFNGLG